MLCVIVPVDSEDSPGEARSLAWSRLEALAPPATGIFRSMGEDSMDKSSFGGRLKVLAWGAVTAVIGVETEDVDVAAVCK